MNRIPHQVVHEYAHLIATESPNEVYGLLFWFRAYLNGRLIHTAEYLDVLYGMQRATGRENKTDYEYRYVCAVMDAGGKLTGSTTNDRKHYLPDGLYHDFPMAVLHVLNNSEIAGATM